MLKLFARKVIGDYEKQEIEAGKTLFQKSHTLADSMTRKSGKQFEEFCRILAEARVYTEFAHELRSQYAEEMAMIKARKGRGTVERSLEGTCMCTVCTCTCFGVRMCKRVSVSTLCMCTCTSVCTYVCVSVCACGVCVFVCVYMNCHMYAESHVPTKYNLLCYYVYNFAQSHDCTVIAIQQGRGWCTSYLTLVCSNAFTCLVHSPSNASTP